MFAAGYLTEIHPDEGFAVYVPFPSTYLLEKRQITEVEVRLDDGRTISNKQRRAIYSILRDISDKTGYLPEEAKEVMKYCFVASTGGDYFSLSNCSMTTGWHFTRYLVDFCLEHDVSTKIPLLEWLDGDISWYVYRCLIHKRCCITQKKAQLHHVDAVGMGRNRNDIIHQGMRVLPLFWRKHDEAHRIGKKSFEEKYHVTPIALNEELCKVWKVKYERGTTQ